MERPESKRSARRQAWGAQALSAEDWEHAARARGLDAKTRRLALNLADGRLKGVFGATRLEFFDASTLTLLAEPVEVAGLSVAGLQDLMAMKLKVMAERGEMRDYFDVKAIEEQGAVSVEEGIGLYMRLADLEQTLERAGLTLASVHDEQGAEHPPDADQHELYVVARRPE